MLTFRQTVFMISSEELEIDYLECKICQKEFPKFDQRGFRNAGFTAHQNRCIEKNYMRNNPDLDRHQSPKQRLILPAPIMVPSSSTPSSTLLTVRSNSSSPTNVLQEEYQPYSQFQIQQHGHVYNPSFNQSNTFQIEQSEMSLFSQYSTNTIFPITHCQYCQPEFGLHQPSCLLLAELLRQ